MAKRRKKVKYSKGSGSTYNPSIGSLRKLKSKKEPTINTSPSRRGRTPYRSEAELKASSELWREYEKLKRRIENIHNKYGEVPAVEQYYDKGLDKFSTKGKSLEEMNVLRADIEYVSGLKTSYVEGVNRYQKYVAEWIDLYDKDRGMYDRIMMLYNRLVEENELAEKFKYAIIEDIYTMIEAKDATNPEIYNHIKELFDDIYLHQRVSDVLGGTVYATSGKVRYNK